ncbi:MAG TPA: hypothetical protein VF462_16895 [Micromonosporaceae bacterium]
MRRVHRARTRLGYRVSRVRARAVTVYGRRFGTEVLPKLAAASG